MAISKKEIRIKKARLKIKLIILNAVLGAWRLRSEKIKPQTDEIMNKKTATKNMPFELRTKTNAVQNSISDKIVAFAARSIFKITYGFN